MRPGIHPPGKEVHKRHAMAQATIRKTYAYHEDDVSTEPEILENNAGELCTSENVDEAITALMSLGYGGGKTPREMMAEEVSVSDMLDTG